MRGEGQVVFAQVINGVGVSEIIDSLLPAWKGAVQSTSVAGKRGGP